MKKRVTFRIAPDLAHSLRRLPNQTAFVEAALRDALGRTCPTCEGTGRVPTTAGLLPNFRDGALGSLDAATARQLRSLRQLAETLAATGIALENGPDGLHFDVHKDDAVLLRGRLREGATVLAWN